MYAFGVNFKTVHYIVTVSALLFLWNIECTEISDGKLEPKDTQIPKNDFQVPFWLNKAARTAQPLENIDEADGNNIPASPVRVIKNKDGKVGISENTILHSGNIHAPKNDYRVPFWLNEATRTAHPLEDIDDGYENNVLHSMNNIRKKVGIAEDAILHPESIRAVRNDFRVPFWLNKEARTAHSVEEVDEDYGNDVPYSLDKAADDDDDDDDDEQNSIVGFAEDAISDLAFDGSSTHLDEVDSNHKNSQTNEIREFYVIDREPKDSLDGEDLITKPRIRGVLTIDVVSQYPANGKKTACPITGVKLRCGFKKCNWDEDKFSVEEGGKGSNSIKLRIHSENDEDFYAYIISVFTKC